MVRAHAPPRRNPGGSSFYVETAARFRGRGRHDPPRPPKKECGVAAGTRSEGSIGALYTDFPPRIRGCRQCTISHNVRDYPGHCWPLRTEVGDFVGARYRLGAKSDLMYEKQMARRHRPRWQGFARHHGVGACVAMLASHVFSIFWPFSINPL